VGGRNCDVQIGQQGGRCTVSTCTFGFLLFGLRLFKSPPSSLEEVDFEDDVDDVVDEVAEVEDFVGLAPVK